MGIFDLFANKKELCKSDNCINETLNFIKVIHSFDDLDCPMFQVGFGDNSISFYFFDSDNTAPCIFKNMIHRKQVPEEDVNLSIGKAIHADELPQGTQIQWIFNDEKNEYDSYIIRYNLPTEHKKCGAIYLEYVKNICTSLGYTFKVTNTYLNFELKKY